LKLLAYIAHGNIYFLMVLTHSQESCTKNLYKSTCARNFGKTTLLPFKFLLQICSWTVQRAVSATLSGRHRGNYLQNGCQIYLCHARKWVAKKWPLICGMAGGAV